MKKLLFPLIALVLILAACGNKSDSDSKKEETKSYKLDSGKSIDVPKSPKRIAVVAPTYAGGVKYLGGKIVAVNKQVDSSKLLKDKFKGVTKVGDNDVEKVAKSKPDLIIVYSTDKNIKKYKKIAPTVVFDYGKHKYLDQQEELGKLLGKEDKVKAWEEKWKAKTKKDGKEIKEKIGSDATVSIFDEFDKKLYSYGPNWGRGGEVLYQAFGLKMPEKLDKLVKKEGWAEIKQEKLADYAGDYIVSTSEGKATPSYAKTDLWNNIPAVKDGHVIKVQAETYWYNDPYTLEYMRKDLKEKLLK
ncbi:ABC transporter substrate-binding protein [Staphylococcus gallinarum]|jgi:iron complex transport system substrate-binding protein|uniref:Ferrichrome ABC transporter substrate-binding protein n=4 Tax=Staphylococcus gallinarum TaxID=1293 RepID=A0A0D0RNA1_STAGA|nr:ABC transporter substrate-binding protein [Staphylococcus gallinarum]KIR11457.1 ferrichrome ABC transporter substrate-binding protein [Staphylococcus gallinarum]MBU7217040.1 ABC transporter substrate-binding protein [Staphylococcus gallinarum]MCD8784979.1 ABC transporter substrate-binding protein [Staphylococcus gallinarum]MCD8792748.1 ABC transporter substrate-binding protein [Staphylococcus gallinarum]MCD8821533.1 ABC transporter substrate-binding protein [Staphylococcus gallinarum]